MARLAQPINPVHPVHSPELDPSSLPPPPRLARGAPKPARPKRTRVPADHQGRPGRTHAQREAGRPMLTPEEQAAARALGDDMNRMTREHQARWTHALYDAYASLAQAPEAGEPTPTVPLLDRDAASDRPSGPRSSDTPTWERTPVTLRALARASGLTLRITRQLAHNANWQIEEVLAPPPPGPVRLTPQEIAADYVAAEEAASELAVSRSHIYSTLRRSDEHITTLTVGGVRFILRADLPKLSLLRDRASALEAPESSEPPAR